MQTLSHKTGIYIHFPFCEKKCPYCDFNSHVSSQIPHKQFEEAFIKDFNFQFEKLKEFPNVISIFFGGGTPSLMLPSTVENVINHICQKIKKNKNELEITLEANPSSFEIEKFKDFKSAGINRVSIGVQSFNEADLKTLGRLHSSTEAKEAILHAKQIFEKLSFDLIYARQSQTIENWQAELKFALQEFTPSHISLYSLTIEKGTKFFSLHKEGKLEIPPNQDEFYETTNEICSNFRLARYEISNYAKKENECLHNLIYWQGGQYIGIGAGAHGRINTNTGRTATMNFHAPQKYLTQMQEKCNALQTWEVLDEEKLAWEKVSTGLRTIHGFNIVGIEKFLNLSKIYILQKEGMVNFNNGNVIPTQKGLSLCDGICKFIFQ